MYSQRTSDPGTWKIQFLRKKQVALEATSTLQTGVFELPHPAKEVASIGATGSPAEHRSEHHSGVDTRWDTRPIVGAVSGGQA